MVLAQPIAIALPQFRVDGGVRLRILLSPGSVSPLALYVQPTRVCCDDACVSVSVGRRVNPGRVSETSSRTPGLRAEG